MTKLHCIAEIEMPGFELLTDDSDHAAQLFIDALMTGLRNLPQCDFAVLKASQHRLKRFDILRRWADKGLTWIAWRVDGTAWELVNYDLQRS
jgi:hypothetical protein